jgi:MucB/RseB N-terminal domain/MucB/RseB C-terminal domain
MKNFGFSALLTQSKLLPLAVVSIVVACAFQTASAGDQAELLVRFAGSPALSYRAEVQIGENGVLRLLQVDRGHLQMDAGMPAAIPAAATLAPAQKDAALQALFASYQTIWENQTSEIAKRTTRQIRLEPRDGWRYSRVLWLDVETGLPLRSQIFRRKELIEQMQVQHFSLSPSAGSTSTTVLQPAKFAIRNLPKGFILQHVRGTNAQIQHLYTDGLAQVSIFVQAPGALESYGQHQTGAMTYLAKPLGHIDVIGLGDVPLATLERMVSGVESIDP